MTGSPLRFLLTALEGVAHTGGGGGGFSQRPREAC